MLRISAIFIAVCIVLIAGSIGFVVYTRFGFSGAEACLVALGVLIALVVYNTIAARTRDRAEVSDQIATLARSSADLARQLAEFGRQVGTMETRADAVIDRALAATRPLATEIEEMSRLIKQLADQVAAHDVALNGGGGNGGKTTVSASGDAGIELYSAARMRSRPPRRPSVPSLKVSEHDTIVATIKAAIDGNKIDLYLQPIVTLPQRKVRYYEALSRLKTDGGELVPAADFIKYAEAGALMPKLDRLSMLRCVQVVRRLLLKNRDIGLFCNISMATLNDSGFPQLLEFMEANRAIAPALVFEFTQSAVRAMGPFEHESLATLAERGFRFSMDSLTDLRIEPRELTGRGFKFIKVPAALLLNRVAAAATDIHPADLSDLLGRFGIDLIAERIESENTVVDLLDYDVRFGQGFLFSPPRPVRAEALQDADQAKGDAAKPDAGEDAKRDAAAGATGDAAPAARGMLAQLVGGGSSRA